MQPRGMYATGRGVAQNDRESVRWLLLAADQGDAKAKECPRTMRSR